MIAPSISTPHTAAGAVMSIGLAAAFILGAFAIVGWVR